MDVLVSVAIATCNGEKFLEEQLSSIYNQTYKNIEVIVSDDASEDKTIEILKKYQRVHGLKYSVNTTRVGIIKNFEKAIVACEGKYIILSDQDDIWLPEKVSRLLHNIGNASLIYSDGMIYNNQVRNSLVRISTQKWISLFGIDSTNKEFANYVLLNSFILGCSMMFNKEILENARPFYESSYNHDWWLALCAHNKNGVKYLDEVLFKYRIHESNFSMNKAKTRKGLYGRFISLFLFENSQEYNEKKIVINQILVRFKYIFESSFYHDIIKYSNSKKNILNIRGFWYVLKYRKFFFPNFSKLRRSCAVLISILK